jgi:hypothetical protein
MVINSKRELAKVKYS